jgi:hypothetical protein
VEKTTNKGRKVGEKNDTGVTGTFSWSTTNNDNDRE